MTIALCYLQHLLLIVRLTHPVTHSSHKSSPFSAKLFKSFCINYDVYMQHPNLSYD